MTRSGWCWSTRRGHRDRKRQDTVSAPELLLLATVPEMPPGSVNNYSFSHNLITATSCLLTKFLKPSSITVSKLSALVASPLAAAERRSHGQGLDSQQRLLCCLLQGAPRQSPLRDSSPGTHSPEATTQISPRRRNFRVLLLFLIPDPTIHGCSLMNISS